MRYLSLFSGIEAASVAWEPLGWEPVAFCEIDAFPSAVLSHHYPNVPNLGDITKVDWNDFKERYGAVDLIVGGSPCQSFSIAGGRAGLDGESRLMYEYIRAVSDLRPTWFLWENVPGVFSTDGGRAFGILLDAMEELGYGMAWRVLDAQFFGVAQRRRRVFLVGYLGNGGIAAAVLFERDSVSGNTLTSGEKRESLARTPRNGAEYDSSAITKRERERELFADPLGFSAVADNGRDFDRADVASASNRPTADSSNQIVIDRAAFNQGKGALYDPHIERTDVMDSLVARGPHAVCYK